MQISDRRKAIVDAINHECDLKHLRDIERKHNERRLREMEKEDKIRQNRALALIEHEEQNKIKKEARTKSVEEHLQFLKKSSLNII